MAGARRTPVGTLSGAPTRRLCGACRTPLKGKRADALYCNKTCRNRAYEARKRQAELTGQESFDPDAVIPVSTPDVPAGHVLYGLAGGHPVSGRPCSAVIFGESGSGKTMTAAHLVRQYEALGADVLVADPDAGSPEGLAARLGFRADGVPDDADGAAALVRLAYDELFRRNRHRLSGERPLVLVLDEWLELAADDKLTLRLLRRILTGGRKWGVFAMLLSQLVSVKELPPSLRKSSGAVVLHRSHGESAYTALGARTRDLERGPGLLDPGEAYVRAPGTPGVVLVRVPQPAPAMPREAHRLMLAAVAAGRRAAPAPQLAELHDDDDQDQDELDPWPSVAELLADGNHPAWLELPDDHPAHAALDARDRVAPPTPRPPAIAWRPAAAGAGAGPRSVPVRPLAGLVGRIARVAELRPLPPHDPASGRLYGSRRLRLPAGPR